MPYVQKRPLSFDVFAGQWWVLGFEAYRLSKHVVFMELDNVAHTYQQNLLKIEGQCWTAKVLSGKLCNY